MKSARRDRCPNGEVDPPSYVGAAPPVANAATMVAGKLTTTPAAQARPILLCIGIPLRAIAIFVRMPPPTPAKPEDKPIAARAMLPNPRRVAVPRSGEIGWETQIAPQRSSRAEQRPRSSRRRERVGPRVGQ